MKNNISLQEFALVYATLALGNTHLPLITNANMALSLLMQEWPAIWRNPDLGKSLPSITRCRSPVSPPEILPLAGISV